MPIVEGNWIDLSGNRVRERERGETHRSGGAGPGRDNGGGALGGAVGPPLDVRRSLSHHLPPLRVLPAMAIPAISLLFKLCFFFVFTDPRGEG